MVLKNCPFCNSSDPELMTKEGRGENKVKTYKYYVRCRSCYARGSALSSVGKIDPTARNKAVEIWNNSKR